MRFKIKQKQKNSLYKTNEQLKYKCKKKIKYLHTMNKIVQQPQSLTLLKTMTSFDNLNLFCENN